jgi:hypothetical protein
MSKKLSIPIETITKTVNIIKKCPKINKELLELENTKDNLWKHIFECIGYDGKCEKVITADDIKKSGKTWKGITNQFEPRLLCKQDTYDERPQIFKDNNLCILSIKNGEYLLTKNNIYFNLNYPEKKTTLVKKHGKSLLLNIGDSECSLIDNLRYSGLFETEEYLSEPILYGPLLNGRHRCSFKTKIGDNDVDVTGSQFETDSCYESENKILLIEGKSHNDIKSLNMRQLYYPFRTIYDMIGNTKEIICLFINKNKDNSIHIWKFKFMNPLEMTSLKNTDYNKYKLY